MTYAECAEECEPNTTGCIHHLNTFLDFWNSQSTINSFTFIPYTDSIIFLSNLEIESMFLLMHYDILSYWIIPD